MDVEEENRGFLKDGEEAEEDEEITACARRCNLFCTGFGFVVRASFALGILLGALFLFFIIVRAAWFTFKNGERYSSSSSSTIYRIDEFASQFPFCSSKNLNNFEFIRNICWSTKEKGDEMDTILFSLSKSLLADEKDKTKKKRLFLVDVMFNSGSSRNGEQISMKHMPAIETDFNVFRFDLSPDHLFCDIRKESISFRTTEKDFVPNLENSIGWSGWLNSLNILKADDDNIWVDATELVKSLFYIISLPSAISPLELRDSIRITKCSVFPTNVDISIQISTKSTLVRSEEPLSFSFTFSLTLLSEIPSMPAREQHESIGYFTSSFQLVGSSSSLTRYDDSTFRIINRRKQFTYYIDPSVPVKWRNAVKNGIESWNLAFASISNIIRLKVILPTDREWPADYDAADVRYSTVSWSISLDRVFAIGPSTIDPRSGEILNSDIVLSHGWITSWFDDLDFLSDDKVPIHRSSNLRQKFICEKKAHLSSNLRSLLATNISEAKFIEIVEAGLADVVSHEIGHTLGLRHNFKGSLSGPLEQLADKNYLREHGLTRSVMDYLPFNPYHVNSKYAFPLKIGDYDITAIRYGYDESINFENEDILKLADDTIVQLSSTPALNEIASKAGDFSTDEDDVSMLSGSDPEASVFDLSSNPLDYAELMIENVRKLRAQVNLDHPTHRIDFAHRVLTSQVVYAAKVACKYIGGRIIKNRGRKFKSITIKSVDQDVQIRAISILLEILTDNNGLFPTASWIRPKGYCDVGAAEQSCYGVDEVSFKNHSDSAKVIIMRTLMTFDRLQRIDSPESSLSLIYVLENIVTALFESSIENLKLWNLQINWISIVFELMKNNILPPQQHIRVVLRMQIEKLISLFSKINQSSVQSVAAHAKLCLQLIDMGLLNVATSPQNR